MICIFKNKELLKHNNHKNSQKNIWIDIGSKAVNRQQVSMWKVIQYVPLGGYRLKLPVHTVIMAKI